MKPVNCGCDMPEGVYHDWLEDMGWDASELRMDDVVLSGWGDECSLSVTRGDACLRDDGDGSLWVYCKHGNANGLGFGYDLADGYGNYYFD